MRFLTHQAFFSSVRSGDLNQLQELVEKLTGDELIDESSPSSAVSELMSVQNDAGETAVYIAAAENLQDVFSYLIGFCSLEAVKIRSKSDMDAFHVAAKRGHLGMSCLNVLISLFLLFFILLKIKIFNLSSK